MPSRFSSWKFWKISLGKNPELQAWHPMRSETWNCSCGERIPWLQHLPLPFLRAGEQGAFSLEPWVRSPHVQLLPSSPVLPAGTSITSGVAPQECFEQQQSSWYRLEQPQLFLYLPSTDERLRTFPLLVLSIWGSPRAAPADLFWWNLWFLTPYFGHVPADLRQSHLSCHTGAASGHTHTLLSGLKLSIIGIYELSFS